MYHRPTRDVKKHIDPWGGELIRVTQKGFFFQRKSLEKGLIFNKRILIDM